MKKVTLLSLISVGVLAVGTGIAAFSYALFSSSVRIEQGIGSAGKIKQSIYLCPNIWELDSPIYVMHVWDSSNVAINDNVIPSKTVSITVSAMKMDCQVFEFDTTLYNSFVFYRMNPSDATDYRPEGEGGGIWNQTDNITYTSSYDVYRIIDWDGSPNNNSGYNNYNF